MRDILHTLEGQHRALTEQAGELIAALSEGHEAALQAPLARLKGLLEEHLALENERFYPELIRLSDAHGTEETRKLARLFQNNMATIAEGVWAFFTRYDGRAKPLLEFSASLAATLDLLSQRMKEEERTLHPMIRKLLTAAGPAAVR